MKVDGIDQSSDLIKQLGSSRTAEVQESRASRSEEEQAVPQSGGETVQLSDQAKLMAKARMELDKIADVNEKRVNELKEQVESGTYDADGKKIADKLLKESVLSLFG